MVSRAGLEPATTALKVRRRLLNLQARAQNNGLLHVRECTGLHRMFDLRYQTWYQTNTIRNWRVAVQQSRGASGFRDRMFSQNGQLPPGRHRLWKQGRCRILSKGEKLSNIEEFKRQGSVFGKW